MVIMKHTQLLILSGFIVLLIAGYIALTPDSVVAPEAPTQSIVTFEDCKNAGYPVMESYPAQCRTSDGKLFTEIITVPTTTTTPPRTQLSTTFDTSVSLKMHDTMKLPDGLRLELLSINDSRCKEGVQCIWAGELAPTLSATGGNFGSVATEIRLGTITTKSVSQKGYIITLDEADGASATIQVSKTSASSTENVSNGGYIHGQVTIGPLCPVEDATHPCTAPKETYTSRSLVVYWPNQTMEYKRIPLTSDGTYTIALDPGTYWTRIEPAGIVPMEKVKMVVATGKTTTHDFTIDTGIR